MQQNEGKKPIGVGAYLLAELRHAFQDMRQKVIEEGWFGRVVTAAPVIEMARDAAALHGDDHSPFKSAERRPSFEEQWAVRDKAEPASPEHGIDR
jgi:hypothetical protein